jgi:radical SAM superfamily enzyme YgiQ (UPF0313 family)
MDFKGKKCLLIVLPYLVAATLDKTKKGVRSFLAFPYGVMTMASYVKKNTKKNSDCEILDLNTFNQDDVENELLKKIRDYKPDVVGYSMSFDVSFNYLNNFIKIIRNKFGNNLIQIAGGPAASTAYKEILDECEDLDAICWSEGELALTNLLDSENFHSELKKDPWIQKTNMNTKIPKSVVTDDLDQVIDIDYKLVDVSAYNMKEAFSPFVFKNKDSKQFFIVTSRGCPFKCNFCAEPTFHGNGMRYASTQKVYEHVKKLVNDYGLSVLTIYDDQILMNKNRAKELFTLLGKLNIRIEMPNGVTLSYIDDEMATILKSAGVDTLFLAIESGSKRVLRDIIKKPISFSKIIPTVKLLQDNGIFTAAFFVWGLPGEEKKDREDSKKLIFESGLDWAFFNYASPLRGSELYRESIKNNWIPEKYKKLGAIDMTGYILNAGIDKDELEEDMLKTNLEFNFVKNRRFRIGDYETSIKSFLEVVSRHPDQPFAHLCLARSFYFKYKKKLTSEAETHLSKFFDIIKNIPTWKKNIYLFKDDFFFKRFVSSNPIIKDKDYLNKKENFESVQI